MVELAQLKIAFIAGTLGQGGAERQLYYILRALKEDGADIQLLSLTQGEFWEEKIRALSVPVTCVEKRSRLQRLWRMVQLLREEQPDIVQSQHGYTNLYGTFIARLLGVREIGAIRTDARREIRTVGLMGHLNLRLPRLIAVNSSIGMKNAVKLGVAIERLHLLPNVIDIEYFSPVERSQRSPVTLLSVGRLVDEKRVDRFLGLLASLRQRVPVPVRGLVAGDGPLRSQLEQQASELGLLPNGITFLGAIADMLPIYHQADGLVLTSASEGTPNVLLEAMATALPIVATNVGGIPEVVQHDVTGFLFAPDDELGMVEQLSILVQNLELRQDIGKQARKHIVQHYAAARLPVLLSQLYAKSLNGY